MNHGPIFANHTIDVHVDFESETAYKSEVRWKR